MDNKSHNKWGGIKKSFHEKWKDFFMNYAFIFKLFVLPVNQSIDILYFLQIV